MKQRVCIVTCDLLGPVRNGGIGTAMTAFAELMVEGGHDVTVLYPSSYSETSPITHWMGHYRSRGIHFESLFADEIGKNMSYLVYQWLKRQPAFDVIHFHDWQGLGFWSVTAKRQGLAFARSVLVCQVHGQSFWHRHHSGEFLSELAQIETDYLERRSVELSDAIFSPSQYMIDWMEQRGWSVPAARLVTPNLMPLAQPQAAPAQAVAMAGRTRPLQDIVFFGRLETRKGLELFCDAIEPLVREKQDGLSVTFLGKIGDVAGQNARDFIAAATRPWRVPHQVLSQCDTYQANAYLRGPGKLAVICSSIENSPYTVLECLAHGVPFLAADVGGVAELVHPDDRAAALFMREPGALRAGLRAALARPFASARPAVDFAANRLRWRDWHAALAPAPLAAPAVIGQGPLVSVCMSTFNRPQLAAIALASVARQTYPRIEVVLVDDASPGEAARAYTTSLQPEFKRKGWTLIRNETEMWTGRARNHAVAHAKGELVLLMDDDNVAKPHEIETFVRVFQATGADVMTCQQQAFAGQGEPPPHDSELPIGWIPIGANMSQALYENCLGDLNMMVKRDVWNAIGGFTEERCGCEDYEFLARAVLQGYRLECIPELLFYYRISNAALAKRYDDNALYRSFQRTLRPFMDVIPQPLQQGVMLANNARRHAERVAGHGYWSRAS